MARISIIIPVYNAEMHLRQCLDSVLAQSVSDWECICIDDGSSDGSSTILDSYAEKDQRFHVVHQCNGGPAKARNEGLKHTTGEYLLFLDADDAIHPKTLAETVRLMREDVDSVSFGHTEKVEDLVCDGQTQEYVDPIIWCQDHASWWKITVIWGRLWRTELVKDIVFPDRLNGEDTIWCNTALSRVWREVHTTAKLYFYRPFNGLSHRDDAWRNNFKAWPELYAIDHRLAKYNGRSAWNVLRAHPSRETIHQLRIGFKRGYLDKSLLSSAKRVALCCLGVWSKDDYQLLFIKLGLVGFFYYLNRRAKRILVFHNVIERALLPKGPDNGGCMPCDEFESVVDVLGKRWKFTTDLSDASRLTLTFDDGYLNQYSTAFRVLNDRGIPAYLFVAGDAHKMLTIDKISIWFAEAPIECIPGRDRGRFWTDELWPRYMADCKTHGESTFRWLDRLYPFSQILERLPKGFVVERLSGITETQLVEMRKAGWIIGWHTATHTPLSQLADSEARKELTPPRGMERLPMAYPYGCNEQVGEREMKYVAELGYPCAMANTNESSRNESKFFMPRMHIWSNNLADIEYELSGMRYFVQHRRLLPRGNK